LQGLASEESAIDVDYQKSTRKVFVKVLEKLFNSSNPLDILFQSTWQMLNNPDRDSTIPSWAPDFNAKGKTPPNVLILLRLSIFSAGSPNCRTPVQISEGGMLHLDGVSLGRIKSVGKLTSTWNEWSQKARNILGRNMSLSNNAAAKDTPRYHTGEAFSQVFWRTKVLDCKIVSGELERLTRSDVEEQNEVFSSQQ
jgi:hypothetical protein